MKDKNGERETIVFVTATLVDSAGNSIHSDKVVPADNFEASRTSVPLQ
jgi:hypothetical protein